MKPKKNAGPDIQRALDEIDAVFADTSYPTEKTLEAMQELSAVIDGNIDALKKDLKKR